MQGEYVDSIKWYKDGAEFYRIVPNTPIERDRVVIFDRPGLNLDRQKSGVSAKRWAPGCVNSADKARQK